MDSAGDTPRRTRGGFPHSDIRGSTSARLSPRLFAACHVLHRLLAPRHPPNALLTLTITPHQHPHAEPNRASGANPAQQQASRTTNTHSSQINLSMNNHQRGASPGRRGLLEAAHSNRTRRSWRRPARCPTARRQPLQDIERGERSRMIQLGSLSGMAATRGHPPSMSRSYP